jgi:hypothetical protein
MKSNETAEAVLIVLKTIGKWLLYAALTALALGLTFFAYVKLDDYFKSRPKIIDALGGVTIGDKRSDVLFKIEGLVQADKKFERDDEIRYYNNTSGIGVDFTANFVTGVLYGCRTNDDYYNINGVFCNDTGESIIKKYQEVRIVCDKDEANLRAYDAVSFGVRHYLVSNKVVAFRISKPAEMKSTIGDDWKDCD